MQKHELPSLDPETLKAAESRQKKLDAAAAAADSSDPHAKARARKGALVFKQSSRTIKSQAYETDINNMVKGITPFTQRIRPGFYIDETILPYNYEAQFNAVLQAQEAFMLLPPDVRSKFDNDPALLADALGDFSRHDELRSLGVLPPLTTNDPVAKPQKGLETPSPSPPKEGV